jgi:hypothetical protein
VCVARPGGPGRRGRRRRTRRARVRHRVGAFGPSFRGCARYAHAGYLKNTIRSMECMASNNRMFHFDLLDRAREAIHPCARPACRADRGSAAVGWLFGWRRRGSGSAIRSTKRKQRPEGGSAGLGRGGRGLRRSHNSRDKSVGPPGPPTGATAERKASALPGLPQEQQQGRRRRPCRASHKSTGERNCGGQSFGAVAPS